LKNKGQKSGFGISNFPICYNPLATELREAIIDENLTDFSEVLDRMILLRIEYKNKQRAERDARDAQREHDAAMRAADSRAIMNTHSYFNLGLAREVERKKAENKLAQGRAAAGRP